VKNDRAYNRWPREPMQSNPKVLRKDCFDRIIVRFPLKTSGNDSTFCHSRMLLSGILSPPLGNPPTGFSELDIGEPPDVECDIGLKVMREIFSRITLIEFPREYNSLGTSNDEVHHGYCLAVDSTRFQTCPELVEGCHI